MNDPAFDAFVNRQLEWLEMERQAEIEQTIRLQNELSAAQLEQRGICLARMKVRSESFGLGGRSRVELESSSGELPSHRLRPGDIVSLRAVRNNDLPLATGVIDRVRRDSVSILLDDDECALKDLVRVDRVAADITYQRLRRALERLGKEKVEPATRLRSVLFGQTPPEFESADLERIDASNRTDSSATLDRSQLDRSQLEAVEFAMSSRDIALVHGPPGTGKTSTVTEIIRRSVRRGERVLCCAPSNVAVDQLVERLVAEGIRVVRIGHPARLLPSVVEHSLDAWVENAADARGAREIRRELDRAHRVADRTRGADRYAARGDIKRLRAELRDLDQQAIETTLASADVIAATTTGAADATLRGLEFDLVVIDEAAQATEAACWIPLLRGRRAILAGDHRQLPPTILSSAAATGLGRTLFERIIETFGTTASRMLTVQYRMNEQIARFSSDALYDGRVESHPSVATHRLVDLPDVTETDETTSPLWFIDTAGADLEESEGPDGESKSNQGEAKLVVQHVMRLLEAGVREEDIGIITPYNAQVQSLRRTRLEQHDGLEIGTVDGFQGREKEAVVISLVRSNRPRDVGFLADSRRLNVAVTRARRHVALIADSATVSADPFVADLLAWFESNGEYRSAFEYA